MMDKNINAIYQKLIAHHGNLMWWPAKTPYEVIVGAVLTQNTAWSNVEKAIANFGDALTPEFVRDIDTETLIDIIRPAGFFNQKSVYLKAVTKWYEKYNFDNAAISREPLHKLRKELLMVKGVGKETADSILLYAFNLPTFVIDAYTVRLCKRFTVDIATDYDTLKAHFEANLPICQETYNNYHALIVINGKDHCRKTRPKCNSCPLDGICKKVQEKE